MGGSQVTGLPGLALVRPVTEVSVERCWSPKIMKYQASGDHLRSWAHRPPEQLGADHANHLGVGDDFLSSTRGAAFGLQPSSSTSQLISWPMNLPPLSSMGILTARTWSVPRKPAVSPLIVCSAAIFKEHPGRRSHNRWRRCSCRHHRCPDEALERPAGALVAWAPPLGAEVMGAAAGQDRMRPMPWPR